MTTLLRGGLLTNPVFRHAGKLSAASVMLTSIGLSPGIAQAEELNQFTAKQLTIEAVTTVESSTNSRFD